MMRYTNGRVYFTFSVRGRVYTGSSSVELERVVWRMARLLLVPDERG